MAGNYFLERVPDDFAYTLCAKNFVETVYLAPFPR